jgi:hypothetical protein
MIDDLTRTLLHALAIGFVVGFWIIALGIASVLAIGGIRRWAASRRFRDEPPRGARLRSPLSRAQRRRLRKKGRR